VLTVGNCCYVAVCSAAEGASAPTGRRGAGAYRGGRPPTACLNAHCDHQSVRLSAFFRSVDAETSAVTRY